MGAIANQTNQFRIRKSSVWEELFDLCRTEWVEYRVESEKGKAGVLVEWHRFPQARTVELSPVCPPTVAMAMVSGTETSGGMGQIFGWRSRSPPMAKPMAKPMANPMTNSMTTRIVQAD